MTYTMASQYAKEDIFFKNPEMIKHLNKIIKKVNLFDIFVEKKGASMARRNKDVSNIEFVGFNSKHAGLFAAARFNEKLKLKCNLKVPDVLKKWKVTHFFMVLALTQNISLLLLR